MVAGGAEDEYEETSLHPPAALSLPGDELLRAPSAASIVILPVSFAVPQFCHQSTLEPPLSSSQPAQTLPLATNNYQVQQIFANFSSSRIFFFTGYNRASSFQPSQRVSRILPEAHFERSEVEGQES